MKRTMIAALVLLLVVSLCGSGVLVGIVAAHPEVSPPPGTAVAYTPKEGDAELAYLLVKLELATRGAIAGHYTRSQSSLPGVDRVYRRWLARNAILPAAVADRIFSDVVPGATGGRAWVKMVVEEPRNPHNQGDAVSLEMLAELQQGESSVERTGPETVYYAEPIKASGTCLPCHGSPRGEPDPYFPQYLKNGWEAGKVVGAVVARVERRGS